MWKYLDLYVHTYWWVHVSSLDVHFPTDVMCSGVWETLKEFQDPELQSLAASLRATVLAGRAPTTTSKYLYAFEVPEVEALGRLS